MEERFLLKFIILFSDGNKPQEELFKTLQCNYYILSNILI